LSNIPVTSKNATKARAEITLAILKRARAAHPHNRSSGILFLKYLRAGEEVWHESKTKAEWEEASKLGGIEIWMEWLEWRIRTVAGGVDTLVTDATRVLRALGSSGSREIDKLRVVWRVAVAFQQAGTKLLPFHPYSLYIGLFQAIMNVLQPYSRHKRNCEYCEIPL
jgi:hypothetical protein